MTPRR